MSNLRFTWDEKKAATNLPKHHVSFEEALTVFADPLAHIFDDDEHSSDEPREIIIGHTAKHRLTVVYFTQRGETLRLFGARRATRKERRDYEENVGS
ncbi:MAG: BrnT family toxin [Deltaproteobacteria bacterium]|nr:BrnT family toxin [Deltaproteobacteria bacterium]